MLDATTILFGYALKMCDRAGENFFAILKPRVAINQATQETFAGNSYFMVLEMMIESTKIQHDFLAISITVLFFEKELPIFQNSDIFSVCTVMYLG